MPGNQFENTTSAYQPTARNPILPPTAFIPDGEPRVFEHEGQERVFLYGSRDTRPDGFCGSGHDAWSAPVDNLAEWTNHGEIFNVQQVQEIGYGRVLNQHFGAPDCVYSPVTRTYHLYTFLGAAYHLDGVAGPRADATGTVPGYGSYGPKCVMASSKSPTGPFVNPIMCDWPAANQSGAFDPAVLVDPQEDGSIRAYAYWGMLEGGDRCAEIDPTDMHTIIDPETRKPDRNAWRKTLPELSEAFYSTLFEASSIRKVAHDRYVFIYSPNHGVTSLNGSHLVYCYARSPFGPWQFGGSLIYNNGGNNHGSICRVGDQWYVFYHRQTCGGFVNRQAMMEPIDLRIEGDRVIIPQVEMTSQGASSAGLDPFRRYNASIAVREQTLILAWPRRSDGLYPLTRIENTRHVAFKYFDFGDAELNDSDDLRLRLNLQLLQSATMGICVALPDEADNPREWIPITYEQLDDYAPADGAYHDIEIMLRSIQGNGYLRRTGGLKGKLALVLRFAGGDGELCRIREIEFARGDSPTPNPLMAVELSSDNEHGRVEPLPDMARFGESVKLTALADDGYAVASMSVLDANGDAISVIPNGRVPFGPVSYHFSMPRSAVTITARFETEQTR
jgi:hypothetical protein